MSISETDEFLDGMLASHKNQILLVSEDNLVRFTLQNFFKDSNLVITATQNRRTDSSCFKRKDSMRSLPKSARIRKPASSSGKISGCMTAKSRFCS